MFCNNSLNNVKKTGLLFVLLTQSIVAQALTPGAPEASAESAVASGSSEEKKQEFNFPAWPERKQVFRERIPPAPPGPYMSSALSGFSDKGAFSRDRDRSEINMGSSDMPRVAIPMEAFSPDAPWPSNLKSPNRWEPENGYRFVEQGVKKKLYPVRSFNRPPAYADTYNRNPVLPRQNTGGSVNNSDIRTSPYMRPSAGSSTAVRPARPLSRRPAPNNGLQKSGSGRSPSRANAAMNHSANPYRRPAYRAPRPSPARP